MCQCTSVADTPSQPSGKAGRTQISDGAEGMAKREWHILTSRQYLLRAGKACHYYSLAPLPRVCLEINYVPRVLMIYEEIGNPLTLHNKFFFE